MLASFIQYSINVFFIFLVVKYINSFLVKRISPYYYMIFEIIFLAGVITIINNNTTNFIYNTIIVFSSLFLLGYLYDCKLKYKIFVILILYIIGILIETLIIIIITKLFNWDISSLLANNKNIYYYIANILNQLILSCIIFILYKVKKNKNEKFRLDILIFLTSLPILSFIAIYNIITLLYKDSEERYLHSYIIILLIFLYINIIAVILFEKYNRIFKENIEKELYFQSIEYDKEYYKQLEDNQNKLRSIKHDIKNQLLIFTELIINHKDDNVIKQIGLIIEDIDAINNNIYTDNKVINFILNQKLSNKSLKNENICVEVELIPELEIAATDMGIILGNLLDNAIEACKNVDESKRYIHFKAFMHKSNLVFIISNSMTDEEIEIKNMITKKEDKLNHGIGLKSVEKIIKKYNGLVEYVAKDYIFTVNIILHNNKLG